MICSSKFLFILLSLFAGIQLFAAPPVPFSGKLAVDGTNFHGNALFSFSIVDGEGTVHWKHADAPDSKIENFVMNGRYLVLLGGQGMQTLPADLFLQHESLFLRVSVDLKDGKGMRLLQPDQRITSSPYALSAEIARLAERAQVAGGVDAGAITADMIEQALLADLNRTSELGEITREMLPQDVRDDLNREFTIEPGSIGKSLLAQDVRDDINRTITRDRLSHDIIADLNRTVRLQDLSEEVSQSINRPITQEMLPQGVRDELNATITRDRLSADVRADLNRTIGIANLSSEVTDILNQTFSIDAGSITLDQLSQQVRDDINRTITRDRLSSDVLSDINRTITKSMLSQEVLDELNASGGITGSVPGSLIAVPANQSAPSGYELYQKGELKELVWEEKAPVSVARYAFDGVEVLDGKIYFVGGKDGSSAKNIAERYDPETNTWESLSSMSEARLGLASAVLDGKLYAIGGIDNNGGRLSSTEIYDPATESWTTGPALQNEVSHCHAITFDQKIYLVGGQNTAGEDMNQVLCFDPLTNQWSAKTNMPTARHGAKLVWFENRIWAIAGYGSPMNSTVESYDPQTDTWRTEKQLSTARNWPVTWISHERIYVGGLQYGSRIDYFDPANDTWVAEGNLPENKYVADAVVLNDNVYVIGGATASDVYSNKVFAADLNASVEGVHDLYVKTGDASTGTPTVQAEVADGSIGPSKLSSEVSNALKPVVIGQPISVVEVGGASAFLTVGATGGDNTYQWKKDGVDIAGATGSVLSITDLNASQHEGNYTVVVSNAFGSVTSSVAQIDVNGSLTEGLVGWWKFDETEGTVASDSSGNGNDGTLTNGPTWSDGKFGGALNFDGENDLLKLPSTMLNGLTDFSASFHFLENLNNTDQHHFISVANASTDNRFILSLYSNYNFNIYDNITGASLLNYQSNHNFMNWLPIAISRNSSTTKLFVSGILVSHASHSGDSLTISENGLWVGGDQDSVGGGWGATQQLNGSIDDLRIYDRALTAFEIKSLHELGEQPVQESGSGATTVFNGTVADGSITTNQLSEQILKYLKPEITQQPTATNIFADSNSSISVSAEGKYLTYQWKKNGVNLTGETNATLTIKDANATQHEGNYSVVVSNDFGSVESGDFELLISVFIPTDINNLELWLDANDGSTLFADSAMTTPASSEIALWKDKSGNAFNLEQATSSSRPIYDSTNSRVTFNNQHLSASAPAISQPINAFIVLEYFGSNTDSQYIHDSTSGRFLLGENGTLGFGIYSSEGGQNTSDRWLKSDTLSPVSKTLISYTLNGSNSNLFFNGTEVLNGTIGNDSLGGTFVIGANYLTDRFFFNGAIYEFFFYSENLTLNLSQKMEGYLAHKWNLATELPSDHPYKNSAP